ncbi:uncharacterized protein M6B38_270100 [Iris pallida]|uniref:DUF4283 domain-containing protein n=1 Tax=Iris pallida TaxID=29817 RepID=A0AAX6IA79_IRIPA|nr:uncharacterized protein M6B38_270100 [Iris pallida]
MSADTPAPVSSSASPPPSSSPAEPVICPVPSSYHPSILHPPSFCAAVVQPPAPPPLPPSPGDPVTQWTSPPPPIPLSAPPPADAPTAPHSSAVPAPLSSPASVAPARSYAAAVGVPSVAAQGLAPVFGGAGRDNLGCQYSSFLGAPAIAFPSSAVETLVSPLRWALIGKFSHSRPSIDAVRRAMEGMKFAGAVDIGLIDGRHMLLRPSLEVDFLRIRSRELWMVANAPMRVFRWDPSFIPNRESAITPVWVSLSGLPIHLFAREAIFAIAQGIGQPLLIDRATAQRSRPSKARVLIELDSSKPLPPKVRLILPHGNSAWQQIKYERIPLYCDHCYHQGHSVGNCKRRKDREEVANTGKGKEKEAEESTIAGEESSQPTMPDSVSDSSKSSRGRRRSRKRKSQEKENTQQEAFAGIDSGQTSSNSSERRLVIYQPLLPTIVEVSEAQEKEGHQLGEVVAFDNPVGDSQNRWSALAEEVRKEIGTDHQDTIQQEDTQAGTVPFNSKSLLSPSTPRILRSATRRGLNPHI